MVLAATGKLERRYPGALPRGKRGLTDSAGFLNFCDAARAHASRFTVGGDPPAWLTHDGEKSAARR